ncbi:MAG: DUF1800 domain-containing protein [Candidatus Hydrogenedentes bacterium]|nr:DUF1800 domain-containing protein [Candidatus Hydrogenedentota bacterium]
MGIQATIQRKVSEFFQPFTTSDTPPDELVAPSPPARPSRRDILFGRGVPSALLGAAMSIPAFAEKTVEDEISDQYKSGDKSYDPLLRRLVDRCTYGASADDLKLAKQMGYDEYLDYQLDYNQIDDGDLNDRLSDFQSLNWSAKQLADAANEGNYEVFYEAINSTIVRSAYSKRQLYERMVEFWRDHFNIYIEKDYMYYVLPTDTREVVRKHALGKFPDMLWASAHSPAMLIYLDNDPSSKEAPNQNYARELMELHTLGVGNYTQKDVEEVARCFTGYSFVWEYEAANWGTFKFYGWAHDRGKKKVLGREIPKKGGVEDAEIVLDILTADPNYAPITGQFIGRKLANWLWGYNPPQALVDSIADTYVSSGGDIKKMAKVALSQEWLAQSLPKLKRPYHLVMSTLRMVPSTISDFWGIRYTLSLMGHEPYQWAPPNGYPDTLDFWAGGLLPRWRYGSYIYSQNYNPLFNLKAFEGDMDVKKFMNRLKTTFFGGKMTNSDKEILEAYVSEDFDSEWRRRETLGLAVSSSNFQWY